MDGNQDGERDAGEKKERRAYPRYSVEEECQLLLVNHGMPLKARMIDLCLEGCRVRTSEPFPAKVGRAVELAFKVKGFAFRFCGVVRWSDSHQVAGLHFENMIPRRKIELADVLNEMASALAAQKHATDLVAAQQNAPSSFVPAPKRIEAAPAKAEAPKAIERVDVEKSSPSANHTPLPEPETRRAAETPRQAAKPRDRRSQSRHEVDTSAVIFLVRGGSELRGRILDLSIGGCRIHTDEKFPVGIYTRVEIEFYLQGLPFRLGGVIQAIHNRNTIGIRLLDLSERKRQQVLELIDEIEQMRAEMAHEELPAANQCQAENL